MKEYLRTDRNGTRYYRELVDCDRCHGRGEYYWGAVIAHGAGQPGIPQYHGVCFKCNGSGKMLATTKEYTPEYAAKLEADRKAREAENDPSVFWARVEAEREARYAEACKRAKEHQARVTARIIAREEAERKAREAAQD